jgi:hypothetical protein
VRNSCYRHDRSSLSGQLQGELIHAFSIHSKQREQERKTAMKVLRGEDRNNSLCHLKDFRLEKMQKNKTIFSDE